MNIEEQICLKSHQRLESHYASSRASGDIASSFQESLFLREKVCSCAKHGLQFYGESLQKCHVCDSKKFKKSKAILMISLAYISFFSKENLQSHKSDFVISALIVGCGILKEK